jgi:hypothetical protein
VRCAVDLCREGTVLSQMHTWEIRWNGDQLDASLFLAALREYVLAQEDTVVQQLAQPDLS